MGSQVAAVLVVGLVIVASVAIFSIPFVLYGVHRDEVLEDLEKLSCAKGSTDIGCYICKHPYTDVYINSNSNNNSRNRNKAHSQKILGLMEKESSKYVGVKYQYHVKSVRRVIYKYGLSSVIDIGCGLPPAFTVALKTEIPCFSYVGSHSDARATDLARFQEMHARERQQQQAQQQQVRKESSDWTTFVTSNVENRKVNNPLPRNKDLVYYHTAMDSISPEARTRIVGAMCRSSATFVLVKDGNAHGPFILSPLEAYRETNLRGLTRYFLLYRSQILCFSGDFAKSLMHIPSTALGRVGGMIGTYDDIAHSHDPTLVRQIVPSPIPDMVVITGHDGGGGAWTLPGWLDRVQDQDRDQGQVGTYSITVDFSFKGQGQGKGQGPTMLVGRWDPQGRSITWADGNQWVHK
jgi:hypothetical protein